jgi:hypothetical protein
MKFSLKYYPYFFLALFIIGCKEPDPLIKLKTVSQSTTMADRKAKFSDRKMAKKKWKEDRETKIVTKQKIKEHHKKLQSKNTLKAMKAMKKKSDKSRGISW